jgi:putative ABC transport system permease protein
MERNPALTSGDIDEMEAHLLDHVDRLVAEGHDVETAFRQATHRLGGFDLLEQEYEKVRWGRTSRTASFKKTSHSMKDILGTFLRGSVRGIRRHPAHTGINLVGLAIGLAAVLFMALFIGDELAYDTQHADGDRLYRIGNATTGWPYGRLVKENHPEVEDVTYLRSYPAMSIKHEGRYAYRNQLYADGAFLRMFDFPLLLGDRETALERPFTAVLTEPLARELFGHTDVLGEPLIMNDSLEVTITGVSHIDFELLVSFATYRAFDPEAFDSQMQSGWLNLNVVTYIRLARGVDAEAFEEKIAGLPMEHAGDMLRSWGANYSLTLHGVRDIYLDPEAANVIGPSSSIEVVYLMSAIAAFLLLLAIVNFVNLSTARSMKRAKEVGIRKVAGSSRSLLVAQFMMEALVLTGLATLLALLLAAIALPLFNELSGKSFMRWDLVGPGMLMAVLLAGLVVGLLAGWYPALVLSRFAPARVLKGLHDPAGSGRHFRRVLVATQFAISAIIVLGTLLVNNQVRYMQTANPGFDADQVLIVDARQVPYAVRDRNAESLRAALEAHSGVMSASAAYAVPGRNGWRGQLSFPEGWEEDRSVSLEFIGVDPYYIGTIGLDIVAGRDFDPASGLDASQSVIINEAAVREVGWSSPEEAIGKGFTSPGSGKPDGVVIGVVRDFHQHGLQEEVASIMYGIRPNGGLLAVRFHPEQASAVLEHVGTTWAEMLPEYTHEAVFLDRDFARQYEQEDRLRKVAGVFSFLAIVIACLGLLGLVSHETARRTKEIGIRKVLGASTAGIALMLSRQMVVLVMVGYAVAIPVSWVAIRQWQSSFAYAAPISIGWIVAGGALLVLLAIVTSGQQAIRAAMANPAQSIRSE